MSETSHRELEKEISRLRQEIETHNYRYHVLDDPRVSDADYDRLFRRLFDLEKAHPDMATADSPTQRVGVHPLDKFRTVSHTLPMLSLSNAASRQTLPKAKNANHSGSQGIGGR